MTSDQRSVERWLPLTAAAVALGSTPLNVLMHVKRGRLAGVEQEDGWRIDPASLAALLQEHRAGEMPAICTSGCGKNGGGCGNCP